MYLNHQFSSFKNWSMNSCGANSNFIISYSIDIVKTCIRIRLYGFHFFR